MEKFEFKLKGHTYPGYRLHTAVIGSGAASLSAADHLHNQGITDIAVVTERLGGGTSANTGSDKQTYYKLSVCGNQPDSPRQMAASLYDGGAMHGDLAYVESLCSAQGFYRLTQLGVPFPHDRYGGYVGYKTDHDPAQRATSAGPWTSRQMVDCLLASVKRRRIKIWDRFDVIALLCDGKRTYGFIAVDKRKQTAAGYGLTVFHCDNVVFGVGGPGGLYETSVYPEVHSGAIGLALEIGAKAANLTESQFGLSSVDFRWNVSGTYQQVLPRYISCNPDGSDEREFLADAFPDMRRLAGAVFRKGYQWPFDPRKVARYGSSLIDLLVYRETAERGRRVYLDFRSNPACGEAGGLRFAELDDEARTYLEKSNACFGTPIERLRRMNPLAIELYRRNGIDLRRAPLRIDVCAQHNNGGLSADRWWESNVRHLFPVGEVNGSHGVYRPGGSALNAGQVGSLRAAQRIAHVYRESSGGRREFSRLAKRRMTDLLDLIESALGKAPGERRGEYEREFRRRMSTAAAHVRRKETVVREVKAAYEQWRRLDGVRVKDRRHIASFFRARHLAFAHIAYLEALRYYLCQGGGSRGSYLVIDPAGEPLVDSLGDDWRCRGEEPAWREYVQETVWSSAKGAFSNRRARRRPLPEDDGWFETTWREYREGRVYR